MAVNAISLKPKASANIKTLSSNNNSLSSLANNNNYP